ncbi:Hypothetical protein FKW44_006233, partial [Caligus rogercresseyi]
IIVCRSIQQQWGILVSNPPTLVKIRVKKPSNAIVCTLGPRVPPAVTMGFWGFKPIANCKIRVRNPLNAILCTLGLRVPPAVTMGCWGFKPIANCKNT